ncbi:G-protein coupled receptor 4-like [Rhinatrema bivittatum]|uniref:G-protein coupled receptor 4-like n=1 Tax=Rhinatrema bivittatum TaxID=194408 RepID=UPI0011293E6D|nr:G-protein coupled receptor 4-like [Rhinatrema bivittatum]
MNATAGCDLDSSAGKIFAATFYGGVFLLGLPLNCLVLWAMAPQLKTEQCLPVFSASLLASNLLLLVTLPLGLTYLLHHSPWTLGSAVCTLVRAAFFLHLFASVLFLTWISVVRYVAVGHPLRFAAFQSSRGGCLSCATLWLLALALCATGAFLVPSQGHGNGNRSYCFRTHPMPPDYAVFRLVTSVLFYILPCLTLGTMYVLIQRTLWGAASVQAVERERITTMIAVVVAGFALLYGPYHAVECYRCIAVLLRRDICSVERALFLPDRITLAVSTLTAVLIPVFYIVSAKKVRQRIRHGPANPGQQQVPHFLPSSIPVPRPSALNCQS